MPRSGKKRKELESEFSDQKLLSRLVKRIKVAEAIKAAQDSDLYEVLEHQTSDVAL